ncbi:hypothetical protein PYW07_000726 [Mythimna separata]|uniref:Shugoshin C-terminal domain-containing protein n=1 Tax=Mythimna separata TaxID=271217 RepID=A0AAD7YTK8_MYTSE|nr:hypothetical protein PYW07_000726 [Mythimna separata]
MATLENELRELKEQNNELAQKAQYWKMTAAQKEDEKLALMKEVNDLRLKLTRLRNNGGVQARKLDAALQDASEKAISHLVNASAEIAKSMEIAKAYMRERQELEAQSPRFSNIGGTPAAEKSERVHRVPPMMMGGQSLHPVVSLNRVMLNTANQRAASRAATNPNEPTRPAPERAVPMHMLQDVYIPLTRIDISDLQTHNIEMQVDTGDNNIQQVEVPVEFMRVEGMDEEEDLVIEGHLSEGEDYDRSRLDPVSEEEIIVEEDPAEMESAGLGQQNGAREGDWDRHGPPPPPQGPHDQEPTQPEEEGSFENPLEGPSWMLDETPTDPAAPAQMAPPESSPGGARAFSPTVRRRKRTSSPPPATPRHAHYSPRPSSSRRGSACGRILKVMLAKMPMDGAASGSPAPQRIVPTHMSASPGPGAGDARPRATVFDAPSPNGATDSRVIVSNRLEGEIAEQSARSSLGESLERDTQHANKRRYSREHDSARRHHNLDGRDSHHHGRMTSQDMRDSGQSSRQRSRLDSHDSRDSDSGSGGGGDSISEGRTRRVRKAVTYKEKPLNRKLRR